MKYRISFHGLETLEKWERKLFLSSQGILNRLEKSGNFTQNTGKEEILASFYLYFVFAFLVKVYKFVK